MVFLHPKIKADFELSSQSRQSCQLVSFLNLMSSVLTHWVEKLEGGGMNQNHWEEEEWEYKVKTKRHGAHKISINLHHKCCHQVVITAQSPIDWRVKRVRMSCPLSRIGKATNNTLAHVNNRYLQYHVQLSLFINKLKGVKGTLPLNIRYFFCFSQILLVWNCPDEFSRFFGVK